MSTCPTIFNFLSSLEVSMRGRGGFVIGRNMIRQSNVWIQIYDTDFFLVIKFQSKSSLPVGPLLLLFSNNQNLMVDSVSFSLSLSPPFLPLSLLPIPPFPPSPCPSPSFLQQWHLLSLASEFLEWACHCYSWFRSNNHVLVPRDVSSIYLAFHNRILLLGNNPKSNLTRLP